MDPPCIRIPCPHQHNTHTHTHVDRDVRMPLSIHHHRYYYCYRYQHHDHRCTGTCTLIKRLRYTYNPRSIFPCICYYCSVPTKHNAAFLHGFKGSTAICSSSCCCCCCCCCCCESSGITRRKPLLCTRASISSNDIDAMLTFFRAPLRVLKMMAGLRFLVIFLSISGLRSMG